MKEFILKINRVVLLLTVSDVFTWGSLVVISSLTGIYLSNRLGANTVEFVGIGTGIYYITRAVFQIPVGLLTDKIEKDKDEIAILAVGCVLMGLPFIFYPMIYMPWHYFFLQFVFGLGVSLNVVNWRKLFALNVSEGMEGKEYAFYDTVLSISAAILSVVFGVVANIGDRYFDMVMTLAGLIMMSSIIWVLMIHRVDNRESNS